MTTQTSTTAKALLLWLISACGLADPIQVRDDLGRTITLAQPANRIVTLSPHLTEMVLAVGSGEHLVGVSSADRLPARFDDVPRLGGTSGIDREALLVSAPDLVLAWYSGNRRADIDWLETLGMPVFFSEPRDLYAIADTILAIGRLTGREKAGERSAARFVAGSTGRCDVDVLIPAVVVIWDQPLLTVGGRHWINAVLESGGFRNRFADIGRGVFALSPESYAAVADLETVSLQPDGSGSDDDRLAQSLSLPGPGLVTAVELLCHRRLARDR